MSLLVRFLVTARRLSASALWLALGACSPEPATQVIVELSASSELTELATTLQVRVTNDEGKDVLDRQSSIESAGQLARIPLIPRDKDASRRFTVHAALLDAGGATLAEIEAQAGYTQEELRVLDLAFEPACVGKLDCGSGRTCFQGRCLGACFSPRPADAAGRSTPSCGECQLCNGDCAPADDIPCGCPGEMCSAGACVPNVRVSRVDAGSVHSCAALEGGDVYCWGSTTFDNNLGAGRLGTGDAGTDSAVPVLVPAARGRHGVQVAGNATCTWDGGRRFCWGLNFKRELGGDIGSVVPEPHEFSQGFGFEGTAHGFRHFCGLTLANELWCWGYNGRGNIGLGHSDDPVPEPTLVSAGYSELAAGGDHTCAINAAGELYCWGFNASGELGVPGQDVITSPLRPGCAAENSGATCFDDWKEVGAGDFHTCAIRESGQLYCWGGNLNGQVGIGPPTSTYQISEPQAVMTSVRFGDVAGGRSYTCGLDTDGRLYCWGLNEDRQLGIPEVDFIGVPTKVDVEAPGGWRSLGLGASHACAVRADRTLWCWGRNSDGQVGIGKASEAPVARPRRVCF